MSDDQKPRRTPGGKYAAVCQQVMDSTQAKAVVVMVVGGEHGTGMSVLGSDEFRDKMPDILREAANFIEHQRAVARGEPGASH